MKWIMGLLLPTLFTLLAAITLAVKPKPNSIWGYRTLRSMSDEKIWYFANRTWAISTILASLLFCAPAVCLFNAFIKDVLTVVLLDLSAAFIAMFAAIFITQALLRRKFGKKQ